FTPGPSGSCWCRRRPATGRWRRCFRSFVTSAAMGRRTARRRAAGGNALSVRQGVAVWKSVLKSNRTLACLLIGSCALLAVLFAAGAGSNVRYVAAADKVTVTSQRKLEEQQPIIRVYDIAPLIDDIAAFEKRQQALWPRPRPTTQQAQRQGMTRTIYDGQQ